MFSSTILRELIELQLESNALNMLLPKMSQKIKNEVISSLDSDICFDPLKAKILEFSKKKA